MTLNVPQEPAHDVGLRRLRAGVSGLLALLLLFTAPLSAQINFQAAQLEQEALDATFVPDKSALRPIEDEKVDDCAWRRYSAVGVMSKWWELTPELVLLRHHHELRMKPTEPQPVPPGGVHLTLDDFTLEHELMSQLADLENLYFDTSVNCEAFAHETIIRIMGHERLLYGSDYPSSHVLGRYIALGDSFAVLDADNPIFQAKHCAITPALVGLEHLRSLKWACWSQKLTDTQVEDIFWNNAQRVFGTG